MLYFLPLIILFYTSVQGTSPFLLKDYLICPAEFPQDILEELYSSKYKDTSNRAIVNRRMEDGSDVKISLLTPRSDFTKNSKLVSPKQLLISPESVSQQLGLDSAKDSIQCQYKSTSKPIKNVIFQISQVYPQAEQIKKKMAEASSGLSCLSPLYPEMMREILESSEREKTPDSTRPTLFVSNKQGTFTLVLWENLPKESFSTIKQYFSIQSHKNKSSYSKSSYSKELTTQQIWQNIQQTSAKALSLGTSLPERAIDLFSFFSQDKVTIESTDAGSPIPTGLLCSYKATLAEKSKTFLLEYRKGSVKQGK
jgi:hypothetical protein